jgi:hypothetical protein
VLFFPWQVKNKPPEEVTTVRLFLEPLKLQQQKIRQKIETLHLARFFMLCVCFKKIHTWV